MLASFHNLFRVRTYLSKQKFLIWSLLFRSLGLPRWPSGKESACHYRGCRRHEFDPWVRMIPWRRKWQPTPAFFPGKFHGQRSLVGYSPWGHKKSDVVTEL